MSTPRRRLIRPTHHPSINGQKLQAKLAKEKLALARWQSRLKRAFKAVDKCQRKIYRLERQLVRLENGK